MLKRAQRRHSIGLGILAFVLVSAFVGLAVVALLGYDAEPSERSLFTAYTWTVLRFTLLQASLSTILSIALAVPVALALSRRPRFPGRTWILRLMALPMGLPVLVAALGLITIWGRQGLFNSLLSSFGVAQPVSIYGLSGILLAHVFFNLPLACRLMVATLDRLPGEYWLLATGLGMKPLSILRFIEGPALARILPGIAGLIFMLCATSFTLVLILGGGPAATTLEVAIYQSLRFDFDPPRAIALSVLQVALTAMILGILSLLPSTDDNSLTHGLPVRRFDGSTLGRRLWDGAMIGCASFFVLLPLVSIVAAGLQADLQRLVTSPAFLTAASTSTTIALLSGVLSVLFAISIIKARIAIQDMRRPSRVAVTFSTVLYATSSLVLLVPPVVLGTGWFFLLRPWGDVSRLAPYLVIAINSLMALPFVMRVLEPAIGEHWRQTARLSASLGIGGLAKFWRIDRPALLRPMLLALSFAMALSLGDLGAIALFGSNDFVTLPWLLYSRLSSYRTADADGLALILGVICLLLTFIGTSGIGTDRSRYVRQ
jgi:thiamine transport system permease protein